MNYTDEQILVFAKRALGTDRVILTREFLEFDSTRVPFQKPEGEFWFAESMNVVFLTAGAEFEIETPLGATLNMAITRNEFITNFVVQNFVMLNNCFLQVILVRCVRY